ncbi:hypothetical protein [Gordonia sp. CPCC 205333]|uniref:hypothetical protein n=1 Tax=Gordonia sp. CPCC 205333 TaxID=3140790 RepID=UPI003AF358D0
MRTDQDATEIPPYVTSRGIPKSSKASDGSAADITFQSIWWKPENCGGSWGCAVVELTVTGRSATPFAYNDSFVTVGYGGGSKPWTEPEDSNTVGGSTNLNYSSIGKVPPLRLGEVRQGQTIHGYVGFGLNGLERGTDLYIKVTDPADPENTEAGWHTVLD